MYSQDGEEQSGPSWWGGNPAQVARSPAAAAAQLRAATKALAAFNNSRPRGKSPVQMAAVMEEDDDEVAAPAPGRPSSAASSTGSRLPHWQRPRPVGMSHPRPTPAAGLALGDGSKTGSYPCPRCGKVCSRPNTLAGHLKFCLDEDEQAAMQAEAIARREEYKQQVQAAKPTEYPCKKCGKVLTKANTLALHMKYCMEPGEEEVMEADEDEAEARARAVRDCPRCNGAHRAHTCGAPHHPRMMLGQRVKPDDDEEYDEEAEDMLFEGEGKALNPNQAGNPWGLFGGNAYGSFPCPRGCGKVCSRRSALGMHLKSNCMNPLPKGQRRENWGNQVDTLADYDDDEEEDGNQEAEAIMMEGAEEEAYDGQDEDIDVLDVHGEPVAKEAEGYRLFRSRKSKSGYMGVTQISSGRFKAQGPHRKECGPHHGGTYIGVYDTPAEAAVAFAKHVKEYGFDPESLYAGRPADLALWRAGLKPSGRKDANETEQEDSHEEKERAFDGGGGGLLGDESEEEEEEEAAKAVKGVLAGGYSEAVRLQKFYDEMKKAGKGGKGGGASSSSGAAAAPPPPAPKPSSTSAPQRPPSSSSSQSASFVSEVHHTTAQNKKAKVTTAPAKPPAPSAKPPMNYRTAALAKPLVKPPGPKKPTVGVVADDEAELFEAPPTESGGGSSSGTQADRVMQVAREVRKPRQRAKSQGVDEEAEMLKAAMRASLVDERERRKRAREEEKPK